MLRYKQIEEKIIYLWKLGICIRVGHAYAEYAVHADYAHMREYADADENIIHIIQI